MRHKETNADTAAFELSTQQEAAIDLLASGRTLTETAISLDIARQTVSRWCNHNAAFTAGLNGRRQELWSALGDRLRSLAPRALDVIEATLDSDRPLPAAVVVLRACGLYAGLPVPSGPVEVADAEIEQRRHATDRMLRGMAAGL